MSGSAALWTAARQAPLFLLCPGVCSDSCPSSRWCHPNISPSIVSFSCLQSFPASGSFPVSQLFSSGDQSIRASALALVLPVNIQGWSPLGWAGLMILQFKRLARVFSNITIWKHQFFNTPFLMVQLSHLYMTTGKAIALTKGYGGDSLWQARVVRPRPGDGGGWRTGERGRWDSVVRLGGWGILAELT